MRRGVTTALPERFERASLRNGFNKRKFISGNRIYRVQQFVIEGSTCSDTKELISWHCDVALDQGIGTDSTRNLASTAPSSAAVSALECSRCPTVAGKTA